MTKGMILAVSLLALILTGCGSNDATHEYEPSNYIPIGGQNTDADELAERFLRIEGDFHEGDKILEVEKRPVGDSEYSYSYLIETQNGEMVYIDNAIVLPDYIECFEYDTTYGTIRYENASELEVQNEEGVGNAESNTADTNNTLKEEIGF